MLKRILMGLGVVVLLLAAGAGAIFYSAFANNRPIADGQVLAPGVQVVKDGFVSAVLLDDGPGKVALIDAGNDKSGKNVLAALQARGLGAASVDALFLTHGHPDHVNGAKAFPGAAVYALEAELPTVGDAVHVTHLLHDGDLVDVGTLHVEVFALPGHTPGSAAYLTRGVLFFGDSAGGAKDGTLMPAVRWFSKDPSQNMASLKTLAARLRPRAAEVRTLAFAHTGPLEGLGPLNTFAQGAP
jgi:glyoxylase-like metal-dependent hydrolase (beta-lactamase superfamily II)